MFLPALVWIFHCDKPTTGTAVRPGLTDLEPIATGLVGETDV